MEKFALGSFHASDVDIRVEHVQGEKAVLGVTSDYCRAILTVGREGKITSKTASELHIETWERDENTVVSSPREWLDAACETAILPYNVLGDLDLEHPCAFEGFVPDSTFIDQLDCELRDLYYPDHTLYDLATTRALSPCCAAARGVLPLTNLPACRARPAHSAKPTTNRLSWFLASKGAVRTSTTSSKRLF